jgi:hypothetical protein
MNPEEAIIQARQHQCEGAMSSSAHLCLVRAVEAQRDRRLTDAMYWAAQSLAYSVGMLHADYARVTGGKHWNAFDTSRITCSDEHGAR